jgi:hypothetical protein
MIPRIKAMMQPMQTDDRQSVRCCHNAVSISGMCFGVQVKADRLPTSSQEAFFLQEPGGDVLRLLLVALHGGIHGPHILVG